MQGATTTTCALHYNPLLQTLPVKLFAAAVCENATVLLHASTVPLGGQRLHKLSAIHNVQILVFFW